MCGRCNSEGLAGVSAGRQLSISPRPQLLIRAATLLPSNVQFDARADYQIVRG